MKNQLLSRFLINIIYNETEPVIILLRPTKYFTELYSDRQIGCQRKDLLTGKLYFWDTLR
jgi:hypothetical protein